MTSTMNLEQILGGNLGQSKFGIECPRQGELNMEQLGQDNRYPVPLLYKLGSSSVNRFNFFMSQSSQITVLVPLETRPQEPKLNFFQKFLSVWILLGMIAGYLLGYYVPGLAAGLEKATLAQVSIPIAVLLWGMILPMMLQMDFSQMVQLVKRPQPVLWTSFVNYAIQPFTMYGLGLLFFKFVFNLPQDKLDEYLIGCVLLGAAPCTAMVFVWSTLMHGDSAYTLTQVGFNDLILLFTYAPTVKLLSGGTSIVMPWDTLLYSVAFFILIPLILGVSIRYLFVRQGKLEWMNQHVLPIMDQCSMWFLVLMVVLLFIGQAETMGSHWLDILIISVPLIIQTVLVWAIALFGSYVFGFPYVVAGPSSLIACSNFFEMAVAIAVALYGAGSGVTLATVVGVLIEVPVMLALVHVNNSISLRFAKN